MIVKIKDETKKVKLEQISYGQTFMLEDYGKSVFIKTDSKRDEAIRCVRLDNGGSYLFNESREVILVKSRAIVESEVCYED